MGEFALGADEIEVKKVIWKTTQSPEAAGELGMDVSTGIPQAFVGGAVVNLATTASDRSFFFTWPATGTTATVPIPSPAM